MWPPVSIANSGDDVFFLTGTDEHGTKVEQAACARGLTPKQHVDEVVLKFKEVAAKVGASNDFFIRTTDPQHERFVQDFVKRCYDAGDIYKGSYSGLYCPACEAYYIEENLVDGLCPDHGTVPVHMDEDNYFFRLSAFQDRLAAHYKTIPILCAPATATTRRSPSSSRAWTTSPSLAPPSSGASAFPGTRPR